MAPLLENPDRTRTAQAALRAALDDPDAAPWEPHEEEEDPPDEEPGIPPPPEPTSGDGRGEGAEEQVTRHREALQVVHPQDGHPQSRTRG